jgi:hypothetical protein
MPKPTIFTRGNIQAEEDGYYWWLNGVERRDRNETLDVLERDLEGISATHLRQMYRKIQKHQGMDYAPSDMVIRVGQKPQVPLDFDLRDLPELPVTGVRFSFDEGEILLVIECLVEHSSNHNAEAHLDVATLIAPLLGRKRLSLVSADVEQYLPPSRAEPRSPGTTAPPETKP